MSPLAFFLNEKKYYKIIEEFANKLHQIRRKQPAVPIRNLDVICDENLNFNDHEWVKLQKLLVFF